MSKQYMILGRSPWNTPHPQDDGEERNYPLLLDTKDVLSTARIVANDFEQKGFTDVIIMQEGRIFPRN